MKYNYGPQNEDYYKAKTPPKYDLEKVTAPVALFYSKNDLLDSERDVMRLYQTLKNPIGVFKAEDESYNHLDFVWGKNAATLIYKKLLELAKNYQ